MSPRRTPSASRIALVAALLALPTCGDGGTSPDLRTLQVFPDGGLAVGLGDQVRFTASGIERGGAQVFLRNATWSSADSRVATIDASGVATAVAEGETTVTATVSGLSRTVRLVVYVPVPVARYAPGVSYFGRNGYVEYIPGELPVVLSAPHGGSLTPDEIANRTWGVTGTDVNTVALTLAVRQAFRDATGHAPHVVLSHLHRIKLDPNREVEEAAQGDAFAERAWEEYHGYIEQARRSVEASFGGGMYFDMHGHGHAKDRLELGYLLGSDWLNRPDRLLNALSVVQLTSIREIGRTRPETFAEVVRGPSSLGGLLEAAGIPSLPSPGEPFPNDDPYFTGGYATRRHGSLDDTQLVSGVQIEHHYAGIRDSEASRRAYAAVLAGAIEAFILEHFGFFEPVY